MKTLLPILPRLKLLSILVGSFILVGCAAIFIAPYDETTDRLATDLVVLTQTAAVKADAGQLSASERDQFYAVAEGMVKAMQARASLYTRNEQEIEVLSSLGERIHGMHQRGTSPRTSLTTGLRASMLDLQQIQLAKKRSAAFSSGLKKTSANP